MIHRRATLEDVVSFDNGAMQDAGWRDMILNDPHAEEYLARYARTLICADSRVCALGGVMPLRPGVGEFWVAFSSAATIHPVVTLRLLRELVLEAETCGEFHRLQVVIDVEEDRLQNFLGPRGYLFEGRHLGYYAPGKDYAMYAKAIQ